ncbi:MAG: hypothetical protein LQ348_006188 [Seirophora lacunosa]|nr:MAG: hypothetical protein LQ348_006188 [Seirophora lacunosa]
MTPSNRAYGKRLLVSLIDEYASNEPNRPWAAIPRSNHLADGFVDIPFEKFARAIDRAAAWLDQVLGASDGSFETFAYAGEKDIRYPIFVVAAVKTGRKILLPSPFTTNEAQIHLVRTTDCRAFVCGKSFEEQATLIAQTHKNIPVVVSPELVELLAEGPATRYAYTKSWEEAKDDPWTIYHTSGTTGFVGMTTALQMTVFLNSTVIFGPPDRPATADVVSQVLAHARLDGIIVPPSVLEDLCRDDETLKQVKDLKYVHFAGAPLGKEDLFVKHPTEDDLWEYAGRADDIVTLSSGLDLHAAKLERIIEAHPRVRCALVGGVGRQNPFLIVEFTELIAEDSARNHALLSSSEEQDRIDEIWTVVEEANKSCVASVRLTIGLTAVASVGKSLPRTSKGTVARRAAELLYKEQIVDMYAR